MARLARKVFVGHLNDDFFITVRMIRMLPDTPKQNVKLENIDKKLNTLLTSEMQLAIIKCDKGLFQLNKLGKENNGPDMKKRAAKEAIEEFR